MALLAPAGANAETVSFSPGPEQSFVVPSGVTHIKVTAVGEKGQNTCFFTCFTGFGEKVTTTLAVTPGQTIYADFIGGAAASGAAGRGGNAADLRTVPRAEAGSLGSRLVVAGGGGGEGEVEEGSFPGQGGSAGAAEGQPGNPSNPSGGGPGGGGTQAHGGAGGGAGGGTAGEAGQLGQGGKGGTGLPAGNAGGGGGGYYGGGGGGGGQFAGPGGGGGSSFVVAGAEETAFSVNSAEAAAGITITYAGGTETVPFAASGSEQSFVVPAGVSRIKVVAVGQNGVDGCGCGGAGMGQKVTAALAVKHGQHLYVDFVGGGSSSSGGPGGNAADLRTLPRAEAGSLSSRLIVAGGGGGSGLTEENSFGGHGGSAGFPAGGTGGNGLTGTGGGGGTQAAGGTAGKGEANGEAGQLGQGGKGGTDSEGDGAGGGGGYYGGGGGAGGLGGSSGGGGGSSFVVAGGEEVSFAQNGTKDSPSLSIAYKSAVAPSASIATPPDGASYTQGQSVAASFSCSEGTEGPGLLPGSEGCSGSVANGAPIDTSTPGKREFTVTARSQDGLEASKTASYTVVAPASPPTVSILTPAEGAKYSEGQIADADYSCAEGTGGPGLKPGSEGCSGSVANGAPIDTSTPGKHEFTVTARSKDGQEASKSVSYTVAAAPSASIVTPVEGASYGEGETVDASFSCSEGTGGPGLKPGSEGCSGSVPNGSPIDTGTPGEHVFTVTARSQDGQEASKTVGYTVVGAPGVSILTPAQGASYAQGQTVDASYSCSEGPGGPGLKPGNEGCSGPVADGAAIDTATLGEHEFTVTATSQDGRKTSQTATYSVVESCTGASGKGTYGKQGQPGRLSMADSLSTDLSAPQRLVVNYQSKRPRFHLVKLLQATCSGQPGERVFRGSGTAKSASKPGYTVSFSIREQGGGFFFEATLAKGAEETEVAAGPLQTRTQKIF